MCVVLGSSCVHVPQFFSFPSRTCRSALIPRLHEMAPPSSSSSGVVQVSSFLAPASRSGLHAVCMKLPMPQKTGNLLDDDQSMAVYQQFQILVDHCIRDPSHVAPWFAALMSRITVMMVAPASLGSDTFVNPHHLHRWFGWSGRR